MKWLFYCENSQEVLVRMKQTHLGFHFMCHHPPQQPNTINIRDGLVGVQDASPELGNFKF